MVEMKWNSFNWICLVVSAQLIFSPFTYGMYGGGLGPVVVEPSQGDSSFKYSRLSSHELTDEIDEKDFESDSDSGDQPESAVEFVEEDDEPSIEDRMTARQKMAEQIRKVIEGEIEVSPKVKAKLTEVIKNQKKEDPKGVPACVGCTCFAGGVGWVSSSSPGCGMLLGSVIFPFLGQAIKSIKSTASWMTRGLVPSRERDHRLVLDLYEQYYVLKRSSIPKFNRNKIDRLIVTLRDQINAYVAPLFGDFGEKKTDYPITEKLAKLEKILMIPFGQVAPISNPQEGEARLKHHLRTYDQKLAESILEAYKTIDRTSKLRPIRLSSGVLIRPSQNFYFLGNPGVGKTVLARALANALGLPFCELSLEDLFIKIEADRDSDEAQATKLTQCFIKSDNGLVGMNPIIYIDEPDRTANSKSGELLGKLLVLLNSGDAYFKDEFLGIRIPVTQVTFIFSGNSEINDETGALASRFTTIEFPDLVLNQKKEITRNTLTEMIQQLPKSIRRKYYSSRRGLHPNIQAKVLEIAEASGESSLKNSISDSSQITVPIHEPGVRILEKVVNHFFFHLYEQKPIENYQVEDKFKVLVKKFASKNAKACARESELSVESSRIEVPRLVEAQ